MNLVEAINALHPDNADHWTATGIPRMDAIHEMTGNDELRRSDVERIAPDLNRGNAGEFEYEELPPFMPPMPSVEPLVMSSPPPPPAPVEVTHQVSVDGPSDFNLAPAPELEPDPQPDEGIDILEMNPREVWADPDLTDVASRALDLKITQLRDYQASIEKKIAEYTKFSEITSRVQQDHIRNGRKVQEPSGVKAYLSAQARAREEKVRRARAFLESRTSMRDVVKELNPASELDKALNARKPDKSKMRPHRPTLMG